MSRIRVTVFIIMALLLLAVPLLGACTREVVKEVPVEKIVPVEKEVVKEVPIEKTVVVEKTVKALPSVINMPGRVGAATGQITIGLAGSLTEELGVRVAVQNVPIDAGMFTALKIGQGDIAIAGSSTIYNAISGMGDFAESEWGPQPVRLIFRGAPTFVLLYTSKKTGINSYADLKGKRLAWFPGSMVMNNVTGYFLEAMGISWDDVKKVNADSAAQSIDMLKSGIVDMPAIVSYPNPALIEVDATVGLVVLPFNPTPEAEKRFLEQRPMYGLQEVPKGSILGAEEDMKLPMSANQVFCFDFLNEDLVYQFTKALYKVVDVTQVTSDAGWTKEGGCAMPYQAPFHPGAIRFYKEAGIWTAEHDKLQQDLLLAEQKRMADWEAKSGG